MAISIYCVVRYGWVRGAAPGSKFIDKLRELLRAASTLVIVGDRRIGLSMDAGRRSKQKKHRLHRSNTPNRRSSTTTLCKLNPFVRRYTYTGYRS